MALIQNRTVETNGIRMHIAEAGFQAVAPDMRGYGQTDRPAEIEAYTLLHLVGDMVDCSTRSAKPPR